MNTEIYKTQEVNFDSSWADPSIKPTRTQWSPSGLCGPSQLRHDSFHLLWRVKTMWELRVYVIAFLPARRSGQTVFWKPSAENRFIILKARLHQHHLLWADSPNKHQHAHVGFMQIVSKNHSINLKRFEDRVHLSNNDFLSWGEREINKHKHKITSESPPRPPRAHANLHPLVLA